MPTLQPAELVRAAAGDVGADACGGRREQAGVPTRKVRGDRRMWLIVAR